MRAAAVEDVVRRVDYALRDGQAGLRVDAVGHVVRVCAVQRASLAAAVVVGVGVAASSRR